MRSAEFIEILDSVNMYAIPCEDGEVWERSRKFVGSDMAFDGAVPEQLAIGNTKPEEYDEARGLGWPSYLQKLSSRWPVGANQLKYTSPYLEMIHLPQGQRRHIHVEYFELLKRDHHIVQWRAAYNYYMEYGIGDFQLEVHGLVNLEGSEKVWGCVQAEDEKALEYFGERRQNVNGTGYCVMQGFLDGKSLPSSLVGAGGAGGEELELGGAVLCEAYEKLRKDLIASFSSRSRSRREILLPD